MSAGPRLLGVLLTGMAWDAACSAWSLEASVLANPAAAQATGDLAVSMDVWSGDRQSSDAKWPVNVEARAKGRIEITPDLAFAGEGWAATNPRGEGQIDADVREAYAELSLGGVTLKAGRQALAWGRADRINPTDALASRDLQRLVTEEDDNRMGQFAVTLAVPFGGGSLSGIWQPEFRASRLPDGVPVPSLPLRHSASYALRYERFGAGFDFSLTLANGPDHTPWLTPAVINGQPEIAFSHPIVTTLGADFSTTLGAYGIRFEAARYWHDRTALQANTTRLPQFSAVLGIDRSFPGEWMLIAQAVLRVGSTMPVPAPGLSGLAAQNALLHGAWRQTVVGATVSVRKSFAAQRGQAEATGAWLSGGGTFAQLRLKYAVTGAVSLHLSAERFGGNYTDFFGRQRSNNIVMAGVKIGF